jgi:SMC interacting uncharacterized protein involved in chromosome segregation
LKENHKLKELFNQKEQNLINEINLLKVELEKYKNENKKLNINLEKANKIVENQQKNQNQIKVLEDENKNLKDQLDKKLDEINQLTIKIKKYKKEDGVVNYKDIMVINFISTDSSVNHGIKCLPTDTFAEVEEQLYQIYDELRNSNNAFIFNGGPILRFKKISENKIHDGDKVQLMNVEF